ncbi:c-type cytochrome [Paraglaciecola marina]|uniref:c-type cytochrome n=1 Tax=Paraglaciecola marina TaxID=2500157 RepID=UPI00105BFE02|nr:cytochrome c [Paraglaciecola marina]
MNKFCKALSVVLVNALVCASFQLAAQPTSELGKQTFNTCSVCHLPTGEGVPGSFPTLRKVTLVAEQEGGKEYLMSVVLQGLSGQIKSNGATYFGYMQGFAASFTDKQVAAVLNYVLTDLAEEKLQKEDVISESDVAIVRNKIKEGHWPKSSVLRKNLAMP